MGGCGHHDGVGACAWEEVSCQGARICCLPSDVQAMQEMRKTDRDGNCNEEEEESHEGDDGRCVKPRLSHLQKFTYVEADALTCSTLCERAKQSRIEKGLQLEHYRE